MVPLVGRAAQLRLLRNCLERTAAGVRTIALVEGEPGIGKTRLVDAALACAPGLGLLVHRAACQDLERGRPFGVIADALGLQRSSVDPERAAVARLLLDAPDQPGSTGMDMGAGPGVRYQVVEAVLGLVERLALGDPLVLVLENAQWADPSSLLVLHTLARRLSGVAVGVVATFRPPAADAALERVAQDLVSQGADRVRLGPLEDDAVAALAEALAGAPPAASLRAQLTRAHGNPLFVIELVRALLEDGAVSIAGGRAHLVRSVLPPGLRLLLLRGFCDLPSATVEALRAAAVLGTSFEVGDLALVTRRSAAELMPDLLEALRAGVLTEAGTRLAFRHDLLREALYADLPTGLRAGLHLEAARSLAAAGAPPTRVAEHVALGASPGDRQAVRWLHQAARDAAPRAPGVAAGLLQRALEVAEPADPVRDTLQADLVVARLWSGDAAEAEALARHVLESPHDRDVGSRLQLGLIEALLAQGRTTEAHQQGEQALARAELTTEARVQLEAEAAWGRLFTGDLAGAMSVAQQALTRADQLSTDPAACIALNVLCVAALFQGRTGEAERLARASIARAKASPSREAMRYTPHIFLAAALIDADRLDEAEQALQRGRRHAEALGSAWQVPLSQLPVVPLRFLAGQWDDALAEADAGLALAEEAGTRFATMWVHTVVALIAVHRNDLPRAEASLAAAEAELAAVGPQGRVDWLLWARARFEEARGQPDLALAALSNAWAVCAAGGIAAEYPLLGPDLVRLALATGQPDQAASVALQVQDAAARIGAPWAKGAALRCRGLVDDDPEILLQACSALRASPRVLDQALTLEDAGRALAGAGRSQQAQATMEQAAGLYEGLHAARDLARAESQLRALGLRRGRRGQRRRPARGWDSLTKTESAVVDLVVEGLTNRETAQRLFISPRTVETHLAHVFAKLGISSRRELKKQAAHRDRPRPQRTARTDTQEDPTSP